VKFHFANKIALAFLLLVVFWAVVHRYTTGCSIMEYSQPCKSGPCCCPRGTTCD
jgi:hypothetical protein